MRKQNIIFIILSIFVITAMIIAACTVPSSDKDDSSDNNGGSGAEGDVLNVPSGVIVMWSGALINIPEGWALCDGTNNTPDLRGRFVVGYDPEDASYNNIGKTGGERTHTLTQNEMPSHNHTNTALCGNAGRHNHQIGIGETDFGSDHATGTNIEDTGSAIERYSKSAFDGMHSHSVTVTINSTGGGQAHENRPPYYTIAYIVKL